MGVTGSGKTTVGRLLAKSLGWEFLDADDFHSEVNIEKMKSGVALTDADRGPWLLSLRSVIQERLNQNRKLVLACSALKERYRDVLTVDAGVQFVFLHGARGLINERLSTRRDHYMNPALLDSQFETLEEPANGLQIEIKDPPDQLVRQITRHFELS